MTFHVELGGFIQVNSLEEAREVAALIKNISDSKANTTLYTKIYEPVTFRNHSTVELTYDRSKVVYGAQAARAEQNKKV